MRLSARRGLRIRKRSNSNSVEESDIGVPSRLTSRLAASSRKIADLEGLGGRRGQMAGAAQQPAQSGDQFLEAERLGHVVVGARGEAGDPVHHRIARGEEQRGRVGVGFADPLQDPQAVHVGKHDVEDQHVGADLVELGQRLASVVGDLDVPAFVVQRHLDQVGQRRLIIDQQNPDR